MILNFKEAFTFMFKDEKFWQKYIIGTIIFAISIIPSWIMYPQAMGGKNISAAFFLIILLTGLISLLGYGYTAVYANSKITLKQDVLPEWGKDFGKIILTGIKHIGLILFFFPSIIAMAVILTILLIIPAIITAIFPPLGIILCCLVTIPVMVIWAAVILLSITSFFTDLKFFSFFNFKRMFSIMKGNYLNLSILIAFIFVFTILVSTIFNFVSYHLYYAAGIIVSFYIALVFSNLYAQFALIGIQKNNERLEEKKAQENL